MKSIWICVACSLSLIGSVTAQEKITPLSLQIIRQVDPEIAKLSFLGEPGITVNAVLQAPNTIMIGFDEENSKLTTFTDDVGTDLSKPLKKSSFPRKWLEGYSFRPNKAGDAASFTLSSNNIPASGAKSITIQGTLAVHCGSEPKTDEHAGVSMVIPKQRDPIKVGELKMFVNKGFPDGKYISFQSEAPNIKEVTFWGADGKEVKSEGGNRGFFGFNKKYTYTLDYNVKSEAEKLTIKITHFTKMESKKFPIDLKLGVGF